MKYDEICFGKSYSNLEDYQTTDIYINGVDLRRKIEVAEMMHFNKYGLKVLEGCYEGISYYIAFEYKNHFLGDTLDGYIYEDKRYALYEYRCSGVPGDHSLTCKIRMTTDEVIWYDFKNYSRVVCCQFDYSNVQFRFSLSQYLKAINLAKYNLYASAWN